MSATAALQGYPETFRAGRTHGLPNRTSQKREPWLFGTAKQDPDDTQNPEFDTDTVVTVYLRNTSQESGPGTTVSKVGGTSVMASDKASDLNPVRSIVRGFGKLDEGWDGPNSSAPSAGMMDDALVVLQNWPVLDLDLEPSVGIDGSIALELHDEEGFVRGGVEITGEGKAIYSVVDRESIIVTGHFDTTSPTAMIKALAQFKDHLSK